jgi:hypothetical protein
VVGYHDGFHVGTYGSGNISDRDLFIAGFFLYWAEGGKTRRNTLVLTNTDPNMLKNYLSWLKLLKVSKDKLKIKLNLYKDMNVDREISNLCHQ